MFNLPPDQRAVAVEHIAAVGPLIQELINFDEHSPETRGHGFCIEATSIALHVLRALGHTAVPLTVDVFIANPKAIELLKDQTPVAEWPDDAWSVGVSANNPTDGRTRVPIDGRRGWNGHLIVRDDTAGGVIDFDFGSFERSGRIDTRPGFIYVQGPPETKDGNQIWAGVAQDGSAVIFTENPENSGWKHSTAWQTDKTVSVNWILSQIATRS